MSQKKMLKKDLRRSKWRSSLERNERLRLRNQATKSELKTLVKRAKGSAEPTTLSATASALDKAAERGIIHKNQAARRKSRMMKAAKTASAAD